MYPRIIVISNNSFSLTDSNGRTLGNLFYGWPKGDLAQMCVIAHNPNWDLCDNYYCIEDKSMFRAFLHFQKGVGRRLVKAEAKEERKQPDGDTKRVNVGKKTVGKVALREMVWAWKRWKSSDFRQWVDDFNPEVVVLQFGDSFFMLDIAYYIATTRNIPLVIYNTEGYYFFPRNWHHVTKLDWLIFPIYNHIYRKKVERVMKLAKQSVYLNDKLKEDYDRVFGDASTVIYNSSSVEWSDAPLFAGDVPKICYLGNLGLDRDSGLIEIGEVLHRINPDYKINVYGKADGAMQARFAEAPGVDYRGLVSYEEVKRIIAESDILFHVETEKGYQERQLQYAFTTKVADSVASGRCFVVYAPEVLACSKYVRSHRCGWVASSKEELRTQIENILNNKTERNEILANAKRVAVENHSLEGNAKKFQDILKSV